MFRVLTFIIAVFCLLPTTINAQHTQEVGLYVNSLTNLSPSFLYKKHIKENIYKRYNFGVADVRFSNAKYSTSAQINLSFSTGTEKRQIIGERFSFVHGLQYQMGLNLSHNDASDTTNIKILGTVHHLGQGIVTSFGLGYLLGIKYDISPYFYISAETIPTAIASYQLNRLKSGSADFSNFGIFGINGNLANIATLSVVYTFDFHKK
jgi:hypothetical protein